MGRRLRTKKLPGVCRKQIRYYQSQRGGWEKTGENRKEIKRGGKGGKMGENVGSFGVVSLQDVLFKVFFDHSKAAVLVLFNPGLALFGC